MNSVLSSIEHRETPFLHGFECVVEYVPSNQRVTEYVDQFVSLYRVPNREGSMKDARIVAIRLSRVSELIVFLLSRQLLNASSPLSFQALLVAARELAKPRFRHVEIYDVAQEIIASADLMIQPEEWRNHLTSAIDSAGSSSNDEDDQEPPTVQATPHGRSNSPSVSDVSEASAVLRPPPPRRTQPSNH